MIVTRDPRSAGAVAALDCGTNSTRLLVASADGVTLDREMRVTRLGQGVDTTHRLAPEAIERTVSVLRDYRRTMEENDVARARLVATSAARDAENSDDFLSAAEEVTGVVPEILSGIQEGTLSFLGATADLPPARSPAGDLLTGAVELIVDIGGGSTELVAGVPGKEHVSIQVRSLDMGCVRMTERYLTSDPPTPDQLASAREAVSDELKSVRDEFDGVPPGGRVIGLAGTVSTLGSLSRGLETYKRDLVHHTVLAASDVEHWLDLLASEPASARAKRPGMEPGRADVIVAGVLILGQVMEVFGRATCLVSESDILDGIVASLR